MDTVSINSGVLSTTQSAGRTDLRVAHLVDHNRIPEDVIFRNTHISRASGSLASHSSPSGKHCSESTSQESFSVLWKANGMIQSTSLGSSIADHGNLQLFYKNKLIARRQ
uniref:Polygalacturonase n=1 Tax=Caenorhabditis tropicalis TaxID=1561998 RepID=A0A1I7TGJ4_9PELO